MFVFIVIFDFLKMCFKVNIYVFNIGMVLISIGKLKQRDLWLKFVFVKDVINLIFNIKFGYMLLYIFYLLILSM